MGTKKNKLVEDSRNELLRNHSYMDSIRLRKIRRLQNRLAGIFWTLLIIGMIFTVGESDKEVLEAQQLIAYYP